MMTDPIKPLGLSIRRLRGAGRMYEAGGRLFVDVRDGVASPAKRDILVNVLGKSDPLIRGTLVTILERGDFIKSLPNDKQEHSAGKSNQGRPPAGYQTLNDYDPAIVSDLMERSQASIEELQQSIQTTSGPELMPFIQKDIKKLRKGIPDPRSLG